jgi:DNA helicase II / ATP-dependent DNA helicase PcrA
MYVAITRARRRLYLSFAQSRMLHGQVSYGMASSFLRELPDKLLHWLTPRVVARKSFDAYLPSTPSSPASSFADSEQAARISPWRSGKAVFHTKFGEGVIVNLEGSGADARVQVNFRKAGVKWLALEYAKLTAVT